ncbi:hypothetical protein DY000_02037997 [Brassica cretica]|uniref:Transposase MuDR plant domain-containing protein n=1 Tax=Brassica cretica TaxID=69181 RepID=A0ABQ7BP25_BRACR|nr:hypothetical protein DY000_02037997 [Brassica cretica]
MDSQEEVEWCDKEKSKGNGVRFSLVDFVKEGQHFISKTLLKAAFEICAMEHNFNYKLVKSDKKVWYIRCADDDRSWRVRAEGLTGSSYFIIKKYVPHHSCAPSIRNGSVRTASAKTIGTLIMHMYETAKEGPRSNDIVHYMRSEHGVEISYSLAWDALRVVRGIASESAVRGKALDQREKTPSRDRDPLSRPL